MADLATAAELRLYLELEPLAPEETDPRADLLLDVAEGEIRAFTGNAFAVVTDDEQILDGRGSSVLLLPRIPVSAVSEVAELEHPSNPVETVLEAPGASVGAYEWSEDGILRRIDGGLFYRRFRGYRVIYSHGLAPEHLGALKGIVLRVAARAYENPDGTRQEALGRYSYTVAGDQAGVGLYDADRRELEPYMIGPGARPYTPDNPTGP